MDIERTIDDIEQLEEMFEAPDIRPLSPNDLLAANRRHDDMLAHSPWFQLLATVWGLLPLVSACRQTSALLAHCVSSC
jgi:hypothetical protein